MSDTICCVPGCSGTENLVQFPNPVNPKYRECFKLWLKFLHINVSGFTLTWQKLYEEYKSKKICNKHFKPYYFMDKNGMKVIVASIPELDGPKLPQDDSTSQPRILRRTVLLKEPNDNASMEKEIVDDDEAVKPKASKITTHRPAPPITGPLRMNTKVPKVILSRIKESEEEEAKFNVYIPRNKVIVDYNDAVKPKAPKVTVPKASEVTSLRPTQPITGPLRLDTMVPKVVLTRMNEVEKEEANMYIPTTPTLIENNKKATSLKKNEDTATEVTKYRNVEKGEIAEKSNALIDSADEMEIEYLDEGMEYLEEGVEYLDPDPAASDVEDEQVPHEIEYLDMNSFEAFDTPNDRYNTITNVSSTATAPKIEKPKSCPSMKSTKIEPAIETKTESFGLENSNTVNEIQKIKGKPIVIKRRDKSTIQEVMKSRNLKPVDIRTRNNQSQGYKEHEIFKHVPRALHTETVTTYPAPRNVKVLTNNNACQLKTYGKKESNPTAFMDIDDNGCITIKAVSKPTSETNTEIRGLENQPINKINNIQKSKEGPIVIKRLDKSSIQEVMKSRNLQPIDINSPLHKKLSTTLSQLPTRTDKIVLPSEFSQQLLPPNSPGIISNVDNRIREANAPLVGNGTLVRQEQIQTYHQKLEANKKTKKDKIHREINYLLHKIDEAKETDLRIRLKKATRLLINYKKRDKIRKEQMRKSKKLQTNPIFRKTLEMMPHIVRTITEIQFREIKKHTRGHRFSDEEKKLASSLYTQSPFAYKLMRKIGFILPQEHTVHKYNALNDLASAARNDSMTMLRAKVAKMKPENRFCSLLFDEKMLRPENRKKQTVTTIGNEGQEIEESFEADHALVFMVKGIIKFYQEPVSYTFSVGPTDAESLTVRIKSVISDLQSLGFKVMATICDQADLNRKAIQILMEEARSTFATMGKQFTDNVFLVNNEEIFTIYDPPHLLKGVRNNLIAKDLTFKLNGQTKVAKWIHLEMMLKENPEYKGERLVAKLTEDHVYPTAIKINATKYAAQIFSQTVSTYMGYLADKDILPPECRETADLLLFFDQLFDSLNSYLANTHKNGKPLLQTVKKTSAHQTKWTESIQILQTMMFISNRTDTRDVDIDCWIWTLQSMKSLVRKLLYDYKVPNLWMRHLNQDGLEKLYRVEVNPNANARSSKITYNKTRTTLPKPEGFTGEIVTQKVIHAIDRVTRQLDNI